MKEAALETVWYKSRFYHTSTELNNKIRVTASCSKSAHSKELENKERLQLKFFTSLHCHAKGKDNGEKTVGFPCISLLHFSNSVLLQALKRCLCHAAHAEASEQAPNELINVCGREQYCRSQKPCSHVIPGRAKAIRCLTELVNLQGILPQFCSALGLCRNT